MNAVEPFPHPVAFQNWIDSIPGAIFQVMTTPEGLVLAYPYIGDGCYKLLEILPTESAAVTESVSRTNPCLFEAIHPEDTIHFDLAMVRAAQAPHLWEWEGRIVLSGNRIKWIALTVKPAVPQPSEGTILWTAIATDITARKQAELEMKQLNQLISSRLEARTAELAVSQNRFSKLADNVPDLLYEMRLDSHSRVSFTYASPACHRLLNISPEQLKQQGNEALQLVHPEDRDGFKAAIRSSALTLKVCEYECRVVLPSGKQRWVRTVARPQPEADGSIVWYGCLSDTSDRQQIKRQLSASLKELGDVKFALDCSSILAITDHRGRITYANDRFCEISQYGRAELVGQTHRLVNSGCHPAEFFQAMWQTISSGQVWQGEIKNRAKNGAFYWVETTIVPFLDEAGCPYQYVAIRNDITERKQAEIKLRQQAEDLEQALTQFQQAQTRLVQTEKMSSLGQLVAGVAHEINNPVSFIYGNVNPANRYATSLIDLLERYQAQYPDPPEDIAEALEDIDFDFITEDLLNLLSSMKIGAERIRQIVASLRTFSRKDEAEKKSVDIHQGIDSTLMILGHRLKAQQHRPAIEVVKAYSLLPSVFCYAGQLNQVFMNILSNGIDAVAEVDRPRLSISTYLADDWVTVKIGDNGMGMSETVRSQIFNPFFTTKSIGRGTGMGLSISYQIVTERHGGSLSCESRPGVGTTFTIQIPQTQPE